MRVRIVERRGSLGTQYFDVEIWRWWLPVWMVSHSGLSHELAERVAQTIKHPVIEEVK